MPETNSLVVLLCNSAPTDYFNITKNLIKVLQNKPVVLKEPVHKKMEQFISKSGARAAVEEYKKMKSDTANYSIDWLQMYYLSDKLYNLKRFEDARSIAENNILEFPDKDLVALSLANIYLASQRKDEAIKFYKKVLELNPISDEAKNRLRELSVYKMK
jgi:tetratricopeptide (TPR) repeat protein